MSAAQQLGTGHPRVVRWLEQHPVVEVPAPSGRERVVPVEREPVGPESRVPRAPKLTPQQQQLATAIERWREVQGSWTTGKGRAEFERLVKLQQTLEIVGGRHADAVKARDEHAAREPSRRLRRAAHKKWNVQDYDLRREARESGWHLEGFGHRRDEAERTHGRPLDEIITHARPLVKRGQQAERHAQDVEQDLLASGPSGLGNERAVRLLGRRDELSAPDQRRYDKLAGRLAIHDVTRDEKTRDRAAGRWDTMATSNLGRDLALWRHDHGLPLSERQTRTVEKHHQLEQDRTKGRDLGFGYDR